MHAGLAYAVCGGISYLLGAIPFGYIIACSQGVDLYKTGSGSIGATNVLRSVGKKWGYLTFFLDALKGFVAAYFFPAAAARCGSTTDPLLLALSCSALAVAGHNWPVYLRFKGGKGVATSAGALIGIVPILTGIGLTAWIITFLATRYVSLASIIAAVTIVASGWTQYARHDVQAEPDITLPVAMTILGVFAVLRHRSNILRLINGTENRFEFGKKKDDLK